MLQSIVPLDQDVRLVRCTQCFFLLRVYQGINPACIEEHLRLHLTGPPSGQM